MKIIIISSKKQFSEEKYVRLLEERGAIFYESKKVDLGRVSELYDAEDKVLAYDEFNVKGSFAGLNGAVKNFRNVCSIVGLASRYNEVDLKLIAKCGITYCNNPGTTARGVAEFGLMLLIMILRKYPLIINHGYDFVSLDDFGTELKGKSIGIFGYGNIGTQFATLCSKLGMSIVFWSRSRKRTKFKQVDVEELLKQDIIFISVVTSAKSRKIIETKIVKLVKPSHYVVDVTASDELFDKNILIDKVNEGKLAGFAFEAQNEKSTYHPIKGNVVITPHMGWITKECVQRVYKNWTGIILQAAKGKPVCRVNEVSDN